MSAGRRGAASLAVGAACWTRCSPEVPDDAEARCGRGPRACTYRGRAGRQRLPVGRLRLRVLWPDRRGLAGRGSSSPRRCAARELWRDGPAADRRFRVCRHLALPLRRVEVLKVAHHGSSDPGLAGELRVLRPRVAVISVGSGNDYGHPTGGHVVHLAAAPGLARSTARTRTAAIVLESDGRALTVARSVEYGRS